MEVSPVWGCRRRRWGESGGSGGGIAKTPSRWRYYGRELRRWRGWRSSPWELEADDRGGQSTAEEAAEGCRRWLSKAVVEATRTHPSHAAAVLEGFRFVLILALCVHILHDRKLEDEWFKKGYKPPKFEQTEGVSLDDVNAVFNNLQEHLVTEKREKPKSMNAFTLISRSEGFNLGNLFEKHMEYFWWIVHDRQLVLTSQEEVSLKSTEKFRCTIANSRIASINTKENNPVSE